MSLAGKTLQTVDTMNVKLISKKTGAVTARGNTTKANFSNKVDKIEIFSGIGMQKQCTLKTKKTTDITFTITELDLEVMALQNGITLDKVSAGTYFLGQGSNRNNWCCYHYCRNKNTCCFG